MPILLLEVIGFVVIVGAIFLGVRSALRSVRIVEPPVSPLPGPVSPVKEEKTETSTQRAKKNA